MNIGLKLIHLYPMALLPFYKGIVIKMNMVTSGLQAFHNATPEHVAEETLKTLRRTIPTSVPGISFLSGGQTELVATQNLSAINKLAGPSGTNTKPWQLTFCFGRALQVRDRK
jgi:fructose-bisphosphate aldolase class I